MDEYWILDTGSEVVSTDTSDGSHLTRLHDSGSLIEQNQKAREEWEGKKN